MLIRNPLDVIISRYNKQYSSEKIAKSKVANELKTFLDIAPLEIFLTARFQNFAKTTFIEWKQFYETLLKQCDRNKCFFVNYSDMIHDITEEMKKILKFLGHPSSFQTLNCLQLKTVGSFKSKQRLKNETLTIRKVMNKVLPSFNYPSFIEKFIRKLTNILHAQLF